ncbi:MAG: DUF11 domain-containing protein [Methanotrichaceae archaeon]|nr:DUF11 domain-containing protein [Methanotrichaceae archaeon]
MKLIFFAILMLLFVCALAKEDGDEITFEDFALNIGDRIDLGNYGIEFVDVQSVKDGLAIFKISQAGGALEEQRVMLLDSGNTFNGGAEEGGLTITVMDIFDDQSAKVRVEYKKDLGTPRKRTIERSKVARDIPNLVVEKIFDRSRLTLGEDVKVTVTVKNLGSGTASEIQVEDLPPLPEFAYIAGFPPKIKNSLEPGESDTAIYVINAVKEGSVKVPSIQVKYKDSKKNPKSNFSAPFDAMVDPKGRPELDIKIMPIEAIPNGGKSRLNVSIANVGSTPATKIQIQSEIKPSEGLESSGLDKTYFEILPGSEETYSPELVGKRTGNYTIILKATYSDGGQAMLKDGQTEVVVLEREYKYLYLLVIVPIIAIVAWIFKRHREYKY